MNRCTVIVVVAAAAALGAQPAAARGGCQNIAQAIASARAPDAARRPGAGGACEETARGSTAAGPAGASSQASKPSSARPKQ